LIGSRSNPNIRHCLNYFPKAKIDSGVGLAWGFAPLQNFHSDPMPRWREVAFVYGILEIWKYFSLHELNNGNKATGLLSAQGRTAVLYLSCDRQLTGNVYPSFGGLDYHLRSHSYPCTTTL